MWVSADKAEGKRRKCRGSTVGSSSVGRLKCRGSTVAGSTVGVPMRMNCIENILFVISNKFRYENSSFNENNLSICYQ